jgi:diaminopimelate decarboxylase
MCFELFRQLAQAHDLSPRFLIVGSGLGIPYHENDQPLDLQSVARQTLPALQHLRQNARFQKADFVLETGRYLVGEAGVYLTRIVRAKLSRGAEIRICDGGLNHHLAATGNLGSVLHRNYRIFKVNSRADGSASIATSPHASDSISVPMSAYDLYGPLCTSIDQIGRGVMLPGAEVGDLIALRNSGAYGLTSSPIHFISHDPPREILVESSGGKRVAVDVSVAMGGVGAAMK